MGKPSASVVETVNRDVELWDISRRVSAKDSMWRRLQQGRDVDGFHVRGFKDKHAKHSMTGAFLIIIEHGMVPRRSGALMKPTGTVRWRSGAKARDRKRRVLTFSMGSTTKILKTNNQSMGSSSHNDHGSRLQRRQTNKERPPQLAGEGCYHKGTKSSKARKA